MRNNFNALIPISVITSIAICIVLLKEIISDFHEYYGYRDIIIFMVVQFVMTFNIYLTFKLNRKVN
jgi:hypothetical protein